MAEASPAHYIIRTYASYIAIGFAVVKIVNGEEQLINSSYKPLSQAQQTWSNFRRESAALKFALESNAVLLNNHNCIVESDYLGLRMLSLSN